MSDISKIAVVDGDNKTTYNINDETARASISAINTAIADISDSVSALETETSEITSALDNCVKTFNNNASGVSINLTDSADALLQDLKVCGSSTQDGTPTPETPVNIVSTGDSGSVTITVGNGTNTQSITIPLSEPLMGIDENNRDVICEQDGQIGVLKNIISRRVIASDFREKRTDTYNYYTFALDIYDLSRPYKKRNLNSICKIMSRHGGSYWVLERNCYILDTLSTNEYDGKLRIVVRPVDEINTEELMMQFIADNDLTVYYQSPTPVFTPLSDEIQAQWRALKSYYPNTNLLNDGAATIDVTYVADTKNYIDNKITALTALTLEG